MNNFLKGLKEADNYKLTENGGVALKSTLDMVMDMFALGGVYRCRTDKDCILLFKNAFEEDRDLAMKCLFYLADCRGGQGERRFFRVCYKWLAKNYPQVALKNVELIPIYRRWDDVIYSCVGTPIEKDALTFITKQLALDIVCKTPSLLAKWMPSENASSRETRQMGNHIREFLGWTHKEYRKTLSDLRSRINIVEKLMSENRWDEIEFDKIPSKAGLIYRNAFARRDLIATKYKEFAKNKNTKVNANTLYPYEIVSRVTNTIAWWLDEDIDISDTDKAIIEKYWLNQKDYFNGKQSNILCVVDTSGSMIGRQASAPINIAISLGMYAAERAGGPFKDHYISFSSRPQLIKIEGIDFVDKVQRIYKTNLCENTDLTATFDMLLNIADSPNVKEEDIPSTIIVISDMEIDYMSCGNSYDYRGGWTKNTAITEMDKVRAKWAAHGHKMPKLIYWNVQARQNTILDKGEGVSFVSGASPAIFESVITEKSGRELMLDKLQSERYADVKA